jgi:hypothetical protein
MSNFLSAMGLELKAIVADNPIDLNLLNEKSNPIKEPQKRQIYTYVKGFI